MMQLLFSTKVLIQYFKVFKFTRYCYSITYNLRTYNKIHDNNCSPNGSPIINRIFNRLLRIKY